jgi:monoamine oxidase
MTARGRHDVVVIGAGLAGLGAALTLEAGGLDVLVVEAQPRIGGRIHSMRQLGPNAEAGGTYIGAGYERIIATAARFGIRLIDVTPILEFFREQDLVLDNEIIRQAEWPEHAANPFPGNDRRLLPWNYHRVLTMRNNPLAAPDEWTRPEHAHLDISMRDWMLQQGLNDRIVEIGYGINTSFGADASDVSALLLLFRAAFSRQQRADDGGVIGYTAEHGVQRIPEAMAGALAREVALERPVIAIDAGDRNVTVRFADGSTAEARYVVCTAPCGALRRIAIDPPLAEAQAAAIAALPSQPLTQVYLATRRPFWNDDGYAASLFTDSQAGMVAAVRSGDDPERVTHLTAWVMGRNAARLDELPESDAGRRIIAAIEAIRPAARGQLELIGMKSWGADRYAGGAWAYYRPGDVRRYAHAIGRRHGRLLFGGEHLATSSRGMEAALASGEDAAAAILSEA